MEINTKQLAIVAAIGAAAWFLLRKKPAGASVIAATKPAIAPAPGSGDIWGGFGVGGGLMDAIGQAPAPAAPAQATTPAPAPAQAANTPWTMQPVISGEVQWDGKAGWLQANGQPVADGYAFKHLTPEQRAGRTDREMISGLLGG